MKYLLTLILQIFYLCNAACQTDRVAKIKIYKASFYYETIVDIDCGDFFKNFHEIDTILLTDEQKVSHILDQLAKARKFQPNSTYFAVDTRAKVYLIYSSTKTEEICLGNQCTFLRNGEPMILQDKSLIFHIDSLKK